MVKQIKEDFRKADLDAQDQDMVILEFEKLDC